jgi:hypothetical protein
MIAPVVATWNNSKVSENLKLDLNMQQHKQINREDFVLTYELPEQIDTSAEMFSPERT